jgi:L-arabinokinase
MSQLANEPIGGSELANQSIGTAPGRLDVMGGIADYSGSLLLQMPIAEQTRVVLRRRNDRLIRVQSDMEAGTFIIQKEEIEGIPYRELGERLLLRSGGSWASYVMGCFAVLQQEQGLQFEGVDLEVSSGIPVGKGVSSSAALEVATMHAISKAFGLMLDPIQLAVLAQKVENLVVGASCGLMDQLAVNLGRKDHLLPIICQPHEVFDPLPIPGGVRFYGLDSGVRHAVSGSSYGDVRIAAFMAFTVAMMKSGISRNNLNASGIPFGGFWANVSPEMFAERYVPLIPLEMTGASFLENYGVHIDPVTKIDPATTYRLLQAARHPVMENHRIGLFKAGLEGYSGYGDKAALLEQLGALMVGSHRGYESVGLGEPVTSRIVELLLEKGKGRGVHGARTSGGGSGGTVVVMISSNEGLDLLMKVRGLIENETEKELKLFEGSSDGAHYIN